MKILYDKLYIILYIIYMWPRREATENGLAKDNINCFYVFLLRGHGSRDKKSTSPLNTLISNMENIQKYCR